MCVRKAGVSNRDKIEWLRKQVALVRQNDAYWPRERPEIRNDDLRNAALDVIRNAPGQVADIGYLMKHLGRTRDSIVNLCRRLVDEQLITRVGPGQFTLPSNTEAKRAPPPAAEQVITWFEAQPRGTVAKATRIAAAIGRPRTAVDAALHGHGALVKKGLVVQVARGVFKLPDSVA
jgi:hypothetical protein